MVMRLAWRHCQIRSKELRQLVAHLQPPSLFSRETRSGNGRPRTTSQLLSLAGLRGLVREQGPPQRLVMPLVARITANRLLASKRGFVNASSHRDHFSRSSLFFLVVGVELPFDVTKLTVLAKRKAEIAHRVQELGCRHVPQGRFQVLEVLGGRLLWFSQGIAGGVGLPYED